MAAGTINSPAYVPLTGLPARTANCAAQCYTPFGIKRRNVGYVTDERKTTVWLWNGTLGDVVLTSIATNDQTDGITTTATPPDAIPAQSSQRVDVTVTAVEGPLEYEALLTFISSCGIVPALTIIGTRAPHLTGDVGYLLFGHNWIDGLNEHMAWKTDVMIAHDRTEQRVQLRTLPRRSWDVRFLVSGTGRRKFETWFGMRKARYFFMPIWRDMVKLTSPIAAGSKTILTNESSDNYVNGTYVVVWGAWDQVEIRKIVVHGPGYISVDSPFVYDWGVGAALAPGRYCVSLDTRQVNRFTEDVGDYRLTVAAQPDDWQPVGGSPDQYRSLPICPFIPSWQDGDESFNSKWVNLDNDTGLIEFDLHSIEPVMSREAQFLISGRDNIYTWLAFLKARAGRLSPFWLAANDRGFELRAQAVAGDTYIIIEPIDYEYSLKDSPARTHVEMITADGTVIRRMITGIETLPNGDEKLTLDSALPVDIDAATLNRCAWLELVRFDSDNLTIHWVTMDCIEATVPIMVLP